MSFGKKSSGSSTPQPVITQKPAATEPISRTAASAEAQDRVASSADPQSALLSTNQNPGFAGGAGTVADEEMKRRQYNDSGMF